MKVLKTDFDGNPNIGLYAYANDEHCLIGQDVSEKVQKQIEKVLKVPVHPLSIGGTSLIGVFLNGNAKSLIVPHIAFEWELERLEELGIPFKIIETRLTALGNNTLVGKDAAIVSDEYSSDDKKRIRQALGIKVVPGTINETGTVGSQASINSHGMFVSNHIRLEEEQKLSQHLKVPLNKGTINQQNPYVHSGIIANSNGCIIGTISTGVEINDALQALGFL